MSLHRGSDSEDEFLLDIELGKDANHLGQLQLVVAFLFALVAAIWNSAFQVLTEYVPKSLDSGPVRDISHSISDRYLRNWLPNSNLVDILLILQLLITTVRFYRFSTRFASLLILKRYFLLQGLIFLLRGPAIYITMLPQANSNPEECNFTSTGSIVLDTLLVLLRQKITCTDMFFSGHSSMVLLWALLTSTHTSSVTFNSKRRYLFFLAIIWTITIAMVALILVTKFHYSIDVYIGLLLAFMLKQSYYDILSAVQYLRDTPMKLSWSQQLVLWMETGFYKTH